MDKDGNIYVLEKGNFRIQKFGKDGSFILTIGRKGQEPGEILDSTDIELDSKGNIFVFDLGNRRVSKFSSDGFFISSFKPEFGVYKGAIDSEDNIYIYKQHKGKLIHKYDPNGKHILSFMDEIPIEPKRIEPHINGQGMVITNFLITAISFSKEGHLFLKAIYFKVPPNWKEKLKEIIENFPRSSFFDIFDSNGSYLLHQDIPDFVWVERLFIHDKAGGRFLENY